MNKKKQLSAKAIIVVLSVFSVAIFILFFSISYPEKAVVKLKVLSSSQEVSQLFWLSGEGDYSQEKSSIIILKPGGHDYTFTIESSYALSKLRLDPSVRKSVLEIEQIVLEWNGAVVFSLAGEDLKNALSAVQAVALELNRKDGRVIITSIGVDPILELDVVQLAKQYKHTQLMKRVLVGFLLTLLLALPLFYFNSEHYSVNSHFTYPRLKKHWICWFVSFVCLGGFIAIVIPVHFPGENRFLYFVATSYVIGTVLFIPAFWFVTRKVQFACPGQPTQFSWFWFALPSFVLWLFFLLSFWPGSLSPDSLDQWKQVLNGHLRDWHPAFHTMNIWLVTRIVMSPATVAITQIIALGSTAGWALSVFQQYGVPKKVLWCTSLLFALWPVNGFMVITLWKDIAYSIALLVLAIYIFQIVMQKGLWLGCPKNWLLLGSVLALVSLYRHNGIIPVCVLCILLFCFYLQYWKGITFAAILALLIYAGVRGPLYDALEVRRGNPMMNVQQKLKKDFLSVSVVTPNDNKSPLVVQKIDKQPLKEKLAGEKKETHSSGKVWDRVFSASVLWRIVPIDFYYKRIDFVNIWPKVRDGEVRIKYVSSNTIGINENSVFPAGREFLFKVYNESRYNKYLFWMWRPAVYLYAMAGLLTLLSWRHRKKLYLVLVPSLVNSLPMFLVVIHKSIFRYHYPIVLLGIVLIIPLLFLKSNQEDDQSYGLPLK
jgi:hypothetical protein